MADETNHGFLWVWTASEIALLVVLFGLVAASLAGRTSLFQSVSRPTRMVALAFLAVEVLIPLWVFFDLRRRSDNLDSFWMHVAAMPGINIFGFGAYLQARKLDREE